MHSSVPDRSTLQPLGVWTWLDAFGAQQAADFAGQIEQWGYSALWVPEAVGRDPEPDEEPAGEEGIEDEAEDSEVAGRDTGTRP